MNSHEALNSIWDETEANGEWKGVWTPMGGNQFMAQFTHKDGMTISGQVDIP